MNVYRMNKPELIIELEKRSLPTNGLKEELKSRLIEAIDKENNSNEELEMTADEKSKTKLDNTNDQGVSEESPNHEIEDVKDVIIETLNEDQIISDGDQSMVLTVENSINMKTSSNEGVNDSMIVNINEDDDIENEDDDDGCISNSPNDEEDDDDAKSDHQTTTVGNNNNREIDNGDHEIIEISEEVVIDDEDNQENDNNYNLTSSDNKNQLESCGQLENDLDEDDEVMILEKIESRKEELAKISGKTEIWVNNIAEDVKAVELKELFGKYGKVISAKVVMNAKNPSGNCFGCIQLATINDAKSCMKNLDQTEFRGNIITVTNDVNDKISKEKIIRNISPVSSSASWGSKKNSGEKKVTNSLPISSSQSLTKTKNDTFEKDKRPSYRDRPNNEGCGFYKGGRNFNDRGTINKREPKSQYENRNINYNDRSENTKPYYRLSNYRNNSYGYNETRGKDTYPRREHSRDNYKPQYESKYSSNIMSRDRPTNRVIDYPDKMKPCYDYRNKPTKYDPYEEYDTRRDMKRSNFDRPISSSGTRDFDTYYPSSNKRADLYKRSRPDEGDNYFQTKRRKNDFVTSDRSHNYRNIDSPKKYYQEELRKPEYKNRREDYDAPIYSSNSKNERDFCSLRRPMEYSYRREAYDDYPLDKHSNRSNHYNKESYVQQHSTDFGGRSRRY